jgi:hypothetical protein
VTSWAQTNRLVDDEQRFAEVDDHRDRGIRDRLEIDEVAGAGAEPGHADPRQPAGRNGVAMSHTAAASRADPTDDMSPGYELPG